MQDRARGGCCCGLAGETETFEREHTEMIFEQRYRMVGGKQPVFNRGQRPRGGAALEGSSGGNMRGVK